ncbi:hypothetical protein PPYR_12601 [Photinus pyralis]|uniref:Enoyl-[acyl-carrier-protein] reductase, mitochondrial n=1 Tax=Photinus pyralis TaxID=7054 RepID=A0A1Y1KAY2_PHOPY|nr:enoyl-[acyl-carrier-protein] reductase, mitochondrial-like [Photinus pyralis]XP_031354899.1 enoyl-[acyl-carrier-protein] reductase, mitochondrial-like [Photinus pyralis]KAB0792978.1 hypothetical protein PPYR_12598 [Photinus pyralis]KAB0792981.1 hypothetical protein PPYR_12601 [Photinus pyralis]
MFRLTRTLNRLKKVSVLHNNVREQSVMTQKLMYTEYGDPMKVLRKHNEEINDNVKPDEVLVRMLAAPINPADINTIEGKYPSKPVLPAIGGGEGVAEVIDVGCEVRNFAVGDRIVPLKPGMGTWRTHAALSHNFVYKVPKNLGIVEAATLTVNPCTAYRMLRDFTSLKPGDCVIQNGANSACGQYVIQICRVWGLSTVNIVRDRENVDELKRSLLDLGGTHVVTESELRKTNLFKSKECPWPKLGLNCVGGQSALELMRNLAPGGTMVTYGGMSKEPVTVPTSALIFKDIKAVGFWMTRWTNEHFDSEDRSEMLEELVTMMTKGEIHGPAFQMVNFKEYERALSTIIGGGGKLGKKIILGFDSC